MEAIYTHNRDILEDRSLVRMRRTLVKELMRYKNRIKSTLYFFGIEFHEQFNWNRFYLSNRFMDWLNELELNRESGTLSLRILVDYVKILKKDFLEVNKKVRKLSQKEHYREKVHLLLSYNCFNKARKLYIPPKKKIDINEKIYDRF